MNTSRPRRRGSREADAKNRPARERDQTKGQTKEAPPGNLDWISASKAAQIAGESERSIRRAHASGLLPARRTPGGHLRIRPADLENYLHGSPDSTQTQSANARIRNRLEDLEQLNIEIQELQAQRRLDRLRDEQAERAANRTQQHEQQQRADAAARAQAQRDREATIRQQQQEEMAREWLETWCEYGLSLLPPDVPPVVRARAVPQVRQVLREFTPEDGDNFVEVAIRAAIEELLAPHLEAQTDALRRQFVSEQQNNAWRELQCKWRFPGVPGVEIRKTLDGAIETRIQGLDRGSPPSELRAVRDAAVEHVLAPYREAKDAGEKKRGNERMIESALASIPCLLDGLKRNRILQLDSNGTALLADLLRPKARKFLELKVQERDLTEAEMNQVLEDFVLADQHLF